jgi:hypothetical protein
MRSLSTLPLLALLSCAGDGETSETSTETSSTTTNTTFTSECTDWSVTMTQEFTQKELFGDDPLTDLPNEQGPGVALGDLDNDGDLDAILAVGRGESIGFRNDGTGNFTRDAAISVNGAAIPHGNSIAFADLDGDGDLDGVLARGLGFKDMLLTNDGTGAFTSEELPNSMGERISPTFGDINGDGLLDIFVAGFENFIDPDEVQAGTIEGDDSSIYFQDPTRPGAFLDGTQSVPALQQPALTYHGAFIDYDLDNDIDLYLANDFGNLVVKNAMLENDGTGGMTVNDDCNCDYATTAMGIAVGDLNNDHLPDMYMSDWGFNWFLMHDGTNGFIEAQQVYNVVPNDKESEVGWGAAMTDINLDGFEDVVIPYGPILPDQQTTSITQADAVLLGDGTGNLVDVSEAAGFRHRGIGRTAAIGDLNRDGRPDIVISGRVYLAVFLSEGGCENSITLTLDEGSGNHQGFGVEARIEVGDQSFTKWMLPSATYGMSAPEMYIGLGNAPKADKITVTWNDGTTTEQTDVLAGITTISK